MSKQNRTRKDLTAEEIEKRRAYDKSYSKTYHEKLKQTLTPEELEARRAKRKIHQQRYIEKLKKTLTPEQLEERRAKANARTKAHYAKLSKTLTPEQLSERRRTQKAYASKRYNKLKNKIDFNAHKKTPEGRIKHNANTLVAIHIKKGNIIKPEICSACSASGVRIEAHHQDYEKPLNVNWLCKLCHEAIHHISITELIEMKHPLISGTISY